METPLIPIYPPPPPSPRRHSGWRLAAIGLIGLSLGGITPSFMPVIALESSLRVNAIRQELTARKAEAKPLPEAVPVKFNPLLGPDGKEIVPVDPAFGIIIPKIGVNASVVPSVDPTDANAYSEALQKGVAHASTSYFPNEDGLVYLFSHSTNYEWFLKDLNAIFYLLKDLEPGDQIVIIYKSNLYTYRLAEKRVVKPTDLSYIQPISGERRLILQTCWPPGSTSERLLLIADLTDRQAWKPASN